MVTRTNHSLKITCLIIVTLAAHPAFSGGFKIQDQSTRAMGMIDAFIAGADDASAVYYNPAGLTNLTQPQLIGNIYTGTSVINYSGPGGDQTSDNRIYVVPNAYVASPLDADQRWFAGLGVYSPFGLGTKWGHEDAVAPYTTLAEIQLVNVNPTLSYKISDRLSVGLGIDYYKSTVKNRYIDTMFTGGEVDMDADGDGWGWNVGLQFDATENVTCGLTFRSPVTVDYDGDIEFDGLGLRVNAESDIDYPGLLAGGISWQVNPRLRTELAVEWANWSTRDKQVITLEVPAAYAAFIPAQQTAQADWQDTIVIMLGAEYELNDTWTLRGGYGYNETPVPDATADPSLPVGDTHAVSLGAGYHISENVTIDAATVVSYSEERTLTNAPAPPNSEYDSLGAFVSIGVTWNF